VFAVSLSSGFLVKGFLLLEERETLVRRDSLKDLRFGISIFGACSRFASLLPEASSLSVRQKSNSK
jgi:hypothetical protein